MVFSSIPAAYLDPANWQQQTNLQPGANSQVNSQHLHPPAPQPLPSPPPLHSHGVGIRPGSMADRARLANIPMPEAALKCPRCESTNTKFCYFNNYSLSQPRHFCKTCRRYWTRGGALRNVPVGGGCRRNKRTKGSNTKSPVIGDRQAVSTTSCSTFANDTVVPPLRFMAPLHNLSEFSSPQDSLGLNYGSVLSTHVPQASDFQIGNAFVGGNGSLFSVPGLDQWKLQGHHLPFFGGFDNSSGSCSSGGVFTYEGSVNPQSYGGENNVLIRSKLGNPVKMEENQEVNLSKHFSGINHTGNDQYWSANVWNDINCFSTSSATNPI